MSPSAPSKRRESTRVARVAAATLVVAIVPAPVALASHARPGAAAAVTITQFPVQGLCAYSPDSFGLPRSGGRIHEGLDIMPRSNKAGDYVYAVADGTLTRQFVAADEPLAGNGWKLELPDGTFFHYFHLVGFATGLTTGSKVARGQILGQVGATGNAGGPHLHFEVHPGGGDAVDPYPIVHPVDGCTTKAVPPQPDAAAADPGLRPAVRLSLLP